MTVEVAPRLLENPPNSFSLLFVPGPRVQEELASVGRVEGEDQACLR